MESFNRINECLKRIEQLSERPSFERKMTHAEFIQKVQTLRENIESQVRRVKMFNIEARSLRSSVKHDLITTLQIVSPEDLKNFTFLETSKRSNNTPICPKKRFSRAVFSLTKEYYLGASPSTPRNMTPKSAHRSLSQNKFSLKSATPLRIKTPRSDTVDCTPKMPERRVHVKPSVQKRMSAALKRNTELVRTQELKSYTLNSHEFSSQKFPTSLNDCNATPPKVARQVYTRERETTPTNNQKVSFFSNPNVGNIHKRYVAIQDSKAEESTCLLSNTLFRKKSGTPELPQALHHDSGTPDLPRSVQKKSHATTPAKKDNSTPPMPISSLKKRKTLNHTSSCRPDRTPSPPRPKAFKSRGCLEKRLEALQITKNTEGRKTEFAQPQQRDPLKDMNQLDQTCELSQKLSKVRLASNESINSKGFLEARSASNLSSSSSKSDGKTASLRPSKLLRSNTAK